MSHHAPLMQPTVAKRRRRYDMTHDTCHYLVFACRLASCLADVVCIAGMYESVWVRVWNDLSKPFRHLSFRDRSDLNTLVTSTWIGRIDMSCAHGQWVANGNISVYEVLVAQLNGLVWPDPVRLRTPHVESAMLAIVSRSSRINLDSLKLKPCGTTLMVDVLYRFSFPLEIRTEMEERMQSDPSVSLIVSIGPELTKYYPLENPLDSSQRSWISWCPSALGFWVAPWLFWD